MFPIFLLSKYFHFNWWWRDLELKQSDFPGICFVHVYGMYSQELEAWPGGLRQPAQGAGVEPEPLERRAAQSARRRLQPVRGQVPAHTLTTDTARSPHTFYSFAHLLLVEDVHPRARCIDSSVNHLKLHRCFAANRVLSTTSPFVTNNE